MIDFVLFDAKVGYVQMWALLEREAAHVFHVLTRMISYESRLTKTHESQEDRVLE